MISINLLDSKRKQIIKRQSLAKQTNLGSFISSICLVILAILSFVGQQYGAGVVERMDNEIATKQRQLDQESIVFEELSLIAEKLGSITSILEIRSLSQEKLSIVNRLLTIEYIELRDINFGGSVNPRDFEFAASVDNVTNYNQFHEFMRQIGEEYRLESIVLENIGRTDTGGYNVDYIMRFPSEINSGDEEI